MFVFPWGFLFINFVGFEVLELFELRGEWREWLHDLQNIDF